MIFHTQIFILKGKLFMNTKEFGSSLIEVMISLLILAIGLLGVLGMQVQSLKSNQNAYLYSQAAFLANDIYESINLFSDDASDFEIALTSSTPTLPNCTASDSNCSKSDVIKWTQSAWRTNVEKLLPGGKSAVVLNNGAYEIQIQFIVGYSTDNKPETETYSLNTGLL